jgi:hypothetical protein
MLQVVQNYKSGELRLEEVPVPAVKKDGIFIRTEYSLVSTGTESTAVKQAAMNVLSKAKARPDDVRKAFQRVKTCPFPYGHCLQLQMQRSKQCKA